MASEREIAFSKYWEGKEGRNLTFDVVRDAFFAGWSDRPTPSSHVAGEVDRLRAALSVAWARMRNARGAVESNQVIDKDVHGTLTRGIDEINAVLSHSPSPSQQPLSRPTFPILNGNGVCVDYQLVADHGGQAQRNHYQSVERLAQRGGLSWCELHAVLHDRAYQKMDQNTAIIECRALEARYLAALAPPSPQPNVAGTADALKGLMSIVADSVGVSGYEPDRVTPWDEFPEIEAARVALSAVSQHEPHPDDLAVDRFAAAMKAKLAKKRDEGRGGWEDKDDCSQLFLSHLLREHVEKGDPVDVGNLSMMLHQREERISSLLETLQGE